MHYMTSHAPRSHIQHLVDSRDMNQLDHLASYPASFTQFLSVSRRKMLATLKNWVKEAGYEATEHLHVHVHAQGLPSRVVLLYDLFPLHEFQPKCCTSDMVNVTLV